MIFFRFFIFILFIYKIHVFEYYFKVSHIHIVQSDHKKYDLKKYIVLMKKSFNFK